jgi:serine/threonine protein kinase
VGPSIGTVIADRYRIDALLGQGAMGSVYRATHVKVGRKFAVKLLHPSAAHSPKQLRRWAREAELAGTLRHRNCVEVIDVGETPDGTHYLVMELAEGETLGSILSTEAPLDPVRAIVLAKQLCDGLAHAHGRGLIHRDFKPDNVIVERAADGSETARIVDFGIAILRDDATSGGDRLTSAGLVLGTPHYMAPEHVTGQPIDHRIDLFAFGVVLYEMLTGRMPFDGDGVDVARANLLEVVPAMADRAPGVAVDPLLEAVVRRLLAKVPDDRPPSAKAVRELLGLVTGDRERAAAQLGVSLNTEPPVPYPVAAVATAPTAIEQSLDDDPPTILEKRQLVHQAIWAGVVAAVALAALITIAVVRG